MQIHAVQDRVPSSLESFIDYRYQATYGTAPLCVEIHTLTTVMWRFSMLGTRS